MCLFSKKSCTGKIFLQKISVNTLFPYVCMPTYIVCLFYQHVLFLGCIKNTFNLGAMEKAKCSSGSKIMFFIPMKLVKSKYVCMRVRKIKKINEL